MAEFLQLLGVLFTAFVVGLSGALMPGPLLTVTVSEATRRGASAGPLLVVGHMILEATLVGAIALGFASMLQAPSVIAGISLLGGGVLAWMGQGMVRSASALSLESVRSERASLHPVLRGIVVSLSNPYWTFWWATIGLSYVVMGLQFGRKGVVFFFVGHILSDFAWYALVSLGVAKGTKFISDRAYRWLIRVCGMALIAFSVWFLAAGIRAFLAPG